MHELIFTIPSTQKLSSNETHHPQVKAKKAAWIKNMAYETGLKHLPVEQQEPVKQRKTLIDSEENNKIIKGRIKRRVNKNLKAEHDKNYPKEKYKANTKLIQELVDKEYDTLGLSLDTRPGDIPIDYVYDKVKITVRVSNPTTHLIDPPNFYPTVKPIIDGLTFAGYWKDDNWNHIKQVIFEYDEEKSEKGYYTFTFILEETQ